MRRNSRRRPTGARRATFAAVALILGGGGLVAANVYASATEGGWGGSEQGGGGRVLAAGTVTIDCPDVGQKLTDVPGAAKPQVDTELATLDQQITEAYDRLGATRQAQADDTHYVQNSILGPLKDQRAAVIDRIKTDYRRAGGTAPGAIDGMAACTGIPADQAQPSAGGQGDNGGQRNDNDGNAQNSGGQQDGNGQNGGGQQGNGGQAGTSGPVASDFVDIRTVQPNVVEPGRRSGGSTGSFETKCGVDENKNHNTDNVIVAPGVKNGAHHLHDYVGNQSNDAFATNDTFAAARTSCQNQQDKSSYYWPVLRVQDGTQDFDQNADGGGKEGNVGRILVARQAEIRFVGSPTSEVVAMPRFLRIITGDAKAFTNGPKNANAHWSCTGFEDKVQLTDKYPICPQGSEVVRSFAFQSCWDGQNIDSANHRTHVAFVDADGACPNGFQAIPQLTMRLVYDVPQPVVENGRVRNAYAVDGFPEQLHKPITDHDDFINVMTDELMNHVVDCVNTGKRCGGDAGDQPQNTPSPSADAPSGGGDGSGSTTAPGGEAGSAPSATPGGDAGNGSGATGPQSAQPSTAAPGTTAPTTGAGGAGSATPGAPVSPSVAGGGAVAEPRSASEGQHTGTATRPEETSPAIGEATSAAPSAVSTTAPATDPSAAPGTAPQSVSGGGLAETGAHLWPAAAGAVLVIAGLVVLRRSARRSF
ncbi:DUF1996 domain-containing protein [Streptomyces sp. Ru72]|uniref:DUF1996 domain-containing protein n=1 Tax=Streptomyces sp. Ru72 TaxID=2080747 RepID=UPI000CDDF8FC|nr:DUF1996 domain-containing protein [Streptomyces sp. Ru72]POX46187.1 hypothetical protein C3488_27320 [Streptomyces sp. Ru72]